jgi:hypothetical protein
VHEVVDGRRLFADTVACKTLGKYAIFRLARFCAAESSERIAAANTLALLVNMVNHHICVMFAGYLRVSGRYL